VRTTTDEADAFAVTLVLRLPRAALEARPEIDAWLMPVGALGALWAGAVVMTVAVMAIAAPTATTETRVLFMTQIMHSAGGG